MKVASKPRIATVSDGPLPPLRPYLRCMCRRCPECLENERWDRIFARFATTEDHWETNGLFQSTLRGS